MQNMSYVRMENTYKALLEAFDDLGSLEGMSALEQEYREKLIALCQEVAEQYGEKSDEWDEE